MLRGGWAIAAVIGLAGCAIAGHARAADLPIRELRMTTAYALPGQSSTSRGWITDGPVLRRKPDLRQLARTSPPLAKSDFGISLDCAVTTAGDLTNCRPEVVLPSGTDGLAIARALEPLIGLAPNDAAMARSKGYRITIDAAVGIFPPPETPNTSSPSCCGGDPPPPPPPPPVAKDPLLWFAIDRADACFSPARQAAVAALFEARDQLRSGAVPSWSDRYRSTALEATRLRQTAGACVSELRQETYRFPVSQRDDRAFQVHYGGLVSSFHDLDRVALEVAVGALDRTTGEREDTFPF